jgi:predicted adenylyl cyclase CyaB
MKRRREAEFKIAIAPDDVATVRNQIAGICRLFRSFHEVDHYYYQPGNLANLLRLRFANNVCILGYKHYDSTTSRGLAVAEEYETEISDPDRLPYVLQRFGISHLVTVDKERAQYIHAETSTLVSIDDVAGLGTFVELEYEEAHGGNLSTVEATLSRVLAELHLARPERSFVGYPFLLLRSRGQL